MKQVLFLLLFCVCCAAVAATAAVAKEAQTLDELLQRVEENRFKENDANKERESKFANKRREQTQLLAKAKAALRRQELRAKRLENVFSEQELRLAKLKQQLNERLGAYAQMFGLLKQVARETQGQLNASLISGERRGRAEALEPLLQTNRIASVEQIKTLWQMLLDEMIAQGRVSTFTGTLLGEDGVAREVPITRLGAFVALHQGAFLDYVPAQERYQRFARQPASKFSTRLADFEGEEIITATIDPARGGVLALLVQTPSLAERLEQGGIIGYLILLLGMLGLGLGMWRLLVLTQTVREVKNQIDNLQSVSEENPLGRVLEAAAAGAGPVGQPLATEALELKLHEAILSELPELEKHLPIVKLLAAIAPLLGLLGTVTGMILTFQAITLFGTGDVKLMAGGISQALVTTVLGLITAVPLILLHALASTNARSVRQILEEQAAALVAKRAQEK